ncbi:MAG: hypothetical protein ACREJO_14445 [Phycisphaerales bacterium]
MPAGSSNSTPDRAKMIKIGVAAVVLLVGVYLIFTNLGSDSTGGKSLPPEPASAQSQPSSAPAPAPNPQMDAVRKTAPVPLNK